MPGWLVILLLAPGLLALTAVVVAMLFRRRLPADGPGYYHVLGFDKATQARREATIHADSRQSARGRAELDGIIATEVTRVEESS